MACIWEEDIMLQNFRYATAVSLYKIKGTKQIVRIIEVSLYYPHWEDLYLCNCKTSWSDMSQKPHCQRLNVASDQIVVLYSHDVHCQIWFRSNASNNRLSSLQFLSPLIKTFNMVNREVLL